ncbi:MAG: MFS transporter [Actinomycetota bacterium]
MGGGSVWRNRDVALLVTGSSVNSVGDWLLELALPLYVFVETGSGFATAAVYVLSVVVNVLFGPLGGRLVDSLPLRSTLVRSNVAQIIALVPLFFVTAERVWPVFLVVVLQGLISSVNDPASFALLPRLVSDDELVAANSALSMGGQLARLIGATAGGFAVEFGGMAVVAALDGATFVVGGIAAAMMSDRANVTAVSGDDESGDSSIRAGVEEVRTRPALGSVLVMQGLAFFVFGGFPVVFIVFVTDVLGGGGGDVGLLRGTSAIFGFAAAAVVGTVAKNMAADRLMSVGYVGFGLVAYSFVNLPTITTAIWAYLLLYGATGFPNVAAGVGVQSTMQRLSPPEVMGRVGGLIAAIQGGALGLGALVAGLLLDPLGSRSILNTQATIFVICGVIGFTRVVGRER